MEYLCNHMDKILARISDSYPFLFLDYDGTLVDIAETPEKAIMPYEVKYLLFCLSQYNRCHVAIVSGRSISDLKNLIGLEHIIYSGLHGYEIEGLGTRYTYKLPDSCVEAMAKLKNTLSNALSKNCKDAILEDKGVCLSVHYRQCDESQVPDPVKMCTEIAAAFVEQNLIKILHGKKVIEFMPSVNWNKGSAVSWILENKQVGRLEQTVLPIYIGDDYTDESAFDQFRQTGITVFVGSSRKSKAQYYLNDTNEIYEFLQCLQSCVQATLCSKPANSLPGIRLYSKRLPQR